MRVSESVPGRGLISKDFIAACHIAVSEQTREAAERFYTYRDRPRSQFTDWVKEQPSTQRSYLKAIELTGRSLGMVMFSNGIDHALLLADAFDEPKNNIRIWSYISLARGCLEAMMRTAYVSDRSVDGNQAVLRSAATAIDGLQQQLTMARAFTDVEVKIAEKALEADLRRARRAGIELGYDTKGARVRRLTRDGETVTVALDITGESARRIPEIPAPYRFGSAAAHSGGWFLAHAILGEDGYAPAADPDIILTAVSLTTWPLLAVVASVADADDAEDLLRLRKSAEGRWSYAHSIRRRDHG